LVEEIQALGPLYQKWYMDDGGIVAPVPVLLRIWQILHQKGPSLGLHLNPAKCEWSWLNASTTSDCPPELKKEGVALVPTEEVCILGVPLGSASFSSSYVKERLFPRVKTAMERLQELNDSQSALFLLRVSYGIVRATHFMRTTPLVHWEAHAVEFDQCLALFLTSGPTLRPVSLPLLVGWAFAKLPSTLTALSPRAGGSPRARPARPGLALLRLRPTAALRPKRL